MTPYLIVMAVLGQAPATEQEFHRLLERPISPDYVSVSLREFVDDVRQRTGLRLVLDQPALDKAGIDAAAPAITLRVAEVSVRSLLGCVLESQKLAYYRRYDGLQLVTTRHKFMHSTTTRRYTVGDLVMPPEDEEPGEACMSAESRDNLICFITRSVASPSWAEHGGSGAIAYDPAAQSLVITNEVEVHEGVEQLLEALRNSSSAHRRQILPYPPKAQLELERAHAEFLKTWPGSGFFN